MHFVLYTTEARRDFAVVIFDPLTLNIAYYILPIVMTLR